MKKRKYADVTYGDGLTVYLFAVLANLVMQFALTFAIVPFQFFLNADVATNDYFNLVAMILLQVAFLAVPLIYYGCIKKAAPKLKSPLCKPKVSDAVGVVITVIALVCFYLPAAYFMVLLDKIGYNFSAGVNLDTPGKIILGAIAMVICAPVVEEIIFRGFLLSGLREKFHPIVAVILSGIAFSLMHMNPEQTVYQFFLGCACGLIAVKSGRLLPSMIVHATNNAIAMLLEIPALGNAFERMINYLTATTLSAVLSTVGLAVLGIALIYGICVGVEKLGKYMRRRKTELDGWREEEKETEEPVGAAPVPADQPTTVDPFEGYGIQPREVKNAPKKNKSAGALALFLGGLGICVMMWLTTFVFGIISAALPNPEEPDPSQGQVTQTTEIDINE